MGRASTQPATARPRRTSQEGGLGIAIIKAVSDEFEAGERAEGQGSRLRFTKLLES